MPLKSYSRSTSSRSCSVSFKFIDTNLMQKMIGSLFAAFLLTKNPSFFVARDSQRAYSEDLKTTTTESTGLVSAVELESWLEANNRKRRKAFGEICMALFAWSTKL